MSDALGASCTAYTYMLGHMHAFPLSSLRLETLFPIFHTTSYYYFSHNFLVISSLGRPLSFLFLFSSLTAAMFFGSLCR